MATDLKPVDLEKAANSLSRPEDTKAPFAEGDANDPCKMTKERIVMYVVAIFTAIISYIVVSHFLFPKKPDSGIPVIIRTSGSSLPDFTVVDFFAKDSFMESVKDHVWEELKRRLVDDEEFKRTVSRETIDKKYEAMKREDCVDISLRIPSQTESLKDKMTLRNVHLLFKDSDSGILYLEASYEMKKDKKEGEEKGDGDEITL